MILADSRMDCLRGCLATLSVLVVRIALQEYSKIHEKAYKCIVCEFGGFQNVLRDACVRAIPTWMVYVQWNSPLKNTLMLYGTFVYLTTSELRTP